MKNGKKLQKDTKENVSDITINENPQDVMNGGRTVVLRDQYGEVVLSSTYEFDTFEKILAIANNQKSGQQPQEVKERFYHD